MEFVPATPGSVSVFQRSVYEVLASPSTNSPDIMNPSLASAPHIETSTERQQAYSLSIVSVFTGKIETVESVQTSLIRRASDFNHRDTNIKQQ